MPDWSEGLSSLGLDFLPCTIVQATTEHQSQPVSRMSPAGEESPSGWISHGPTRYSRDMDDDLIRHCLWCHHPQPKDVEAMTGCPEYGLWHSGKMLPGHSAKSVTL